MSVVKIGLLAVGLVFPLLAQAGYQDIISGVNGGIYQPVETGELATGLEGSASAPEIDYVDRARTADVADRTDVATRADNATLADRCTYANSAGSASTATGITAALRNSIVAEARAGSNIQTSSCVWAVSNGSCSANNRGAEPSNLVGQRVYFLRVNNTDIGRPVDIQSGSTTICNMNGTIPAYRGYTYSCR
ncbi:hypothetical protein AB4571_01760 [Vibrio breoganii]|uniref:hypothetical protein n=1 Tax=Vibrio breoganii TaxID=553239 RepID=UPI000C814A16|nr:hypothetical protein [Vibrio breoganii]PML19621.1 hypothetical protein BCT84_18270 [Vibrio breoganii]